ncbi:hypothetical protein ACFSRY_17375 [Pontibacter locisalis]|uniref:Uncharacterized protein n=1 Tax=Pontibacter locisalis TaxID=1719035 RepID=A0ABW5IQL0_9BACT
MKRILFLTSNSLATNPRLVKELALAVKQFECTVISFKFYNWSDALDDEIKTFFPNVAFRELSAGRKPLIPWLCSSIAVRLSQILYPLFRNNLLLNSFAHSKRSFLLWTALMRHTKKYDLVIAHNLASLYPAFSFAMGNNIPFAFDLEDYHPGESIGSNPENEISRRKYLMAKLLPETLYVSYASPLIGDAFLSLFTDNFKKRHFLVNNSFLSKDFNITLEPASEKLSFVWFSQHISFGRGLELVVPILYQYRDQLSLTLIGNLNKNFYQSFLKEYDEVISFTASMAQKELHIALTAFDIGLAIELSAVDLNRELCLTNKIFAYCQAGLYILATDTNAQQLFMNQYQNVGEVVKQSAEEFETSIQSVLAKADEIKRGRESRSTTSKQLAWEHESEKLLNAWSLLL